MRQPFPENGNCHQQHSGGEAAYEFGQYERQEREGMVQPGDMVDEDAAAHQEHRQRPDVAQHRDEFRHRPDQQNACGA